ncbi:hypothetical protein [Vibrio sp. TRT 17S01]|uniref:hypothetical protein n=1 Tax=Vibrio sp. TRT 17S01 TaxID=3418505 RepID=UPI003CED6F69
MELLTSLIGFIGVVVGAVITYVSTYKLKKLELEMNDRQKKKEQLDLIYSSFLVKVSTAISALDLDRARNYAAYIPPIDEDLALIELLSSNEVYQKANLLVSELTDLFLDTPSATFVSVNKLKADFVDSVKAHYKSNV